MAAFDTTRPTYAAGRKGFVGMFASAYASVVSWNEDRQTRRALRQLSDHELQDIGLTRGEIESLNIR